MEIFVEALTNDTVRIDTDADLLKHGIDVGALLALSTFSHLNQDTATFFNIASDVLELLCCER